MKKYVFVAVCLVFAVLFLTACKVKKNTQQTINYQRKFSQYMPSEEPKKSAVGIIDLSEGPKTRYDANFGPNDVNFDIKIVTPY